MEGNPKTAEAATKQHNAEVLKALTQGDLVKIHQDLYTHWAVYIGKEEGVEMVIHWGKGDCSEVPTTLSKGNFDVMKIFTFRERRHRGGDHIMIDPFWTVVGNCKAENGNSRDLENSNIDGSLVVEAAKLQKEKQNMVDICGKFYSSEDFAKRCRYGLLTQKTLPEGLSESTVVVKPILDSTLTYNSDDISIREHNTKLLSTLQIGDLVRFDRHYYYHWAVYIGRDYETVSSEPQVIHWWGPPDFKTSKKWASIMKTSFWEAAKGCKAEYGNEDKHETGNIDGHRVAAKAAAKQSLSAEKLLKETYSLIFNNCEHFAKWCRYNSDDDDNVLEFPRENYDEVRLEIEDFESKASTFVSGLLTRYRKWYYETLKDKEQLKILRKETRKFRNYETEVGNMERNIIRKIYGSFFILSAYITWLSLRGKTWKISQFLRFRKSG